MAVEGPQPVKWSFPAGADLSAAANQYKFVEVDSSGNVSVCNAVTDRPIGVLQNRPKQGEAAEVTISGITKLQADAALAIGAIIGGHHRNQRRRTGRRQDGRRRRDRVRCRSLPVRVRSRRGDPVGTHQLREPAEGFLGEGGR
jgi:hypothetical protein